LFYFLVLFSVVYLWSRNKVHDARCSTLDASM